MASLVSPYGAHCANAFGSGCAYHMQKTQCWAESSWLIKAGAEQFILQRRKLSTIQHRGHTQLFSLGMTINLWQIPLLLAAHSGLTRKKKQLHQQRNVPPRFTRFPVVSERGNYISFRAVCTLLSRWKHEGLGCMREHVRSGEEGALHSDIKGGWREVGVSLCSQETATG